MFKTVVGPIDDSANTAYLRPETAQAIFAQFKNVTDTSRQTVPYGIAQMGKSFRNEVTPRNYIFRSREFEQMELEFFIRPDEAIEIMYGKVVTLADNPDIDGPVQDDWGWEVWHKYWVEQRKKFLNAVGLPTEHFVEYWQKPDELAHYARACVDIEYDFPFGRQELEGIAARSDFDLSQHQKHSGESQMVFDDPLKQAAKKMDDAAKKAFIEKVQSDWVARGKDAAEAEKFCLNLFDGKYVPHVIEPSAGVDRLMLALLCEAYEEEKLTDEKGKEDIRTVLRFSPKVAPIKVAIFPLIKKDEAQDKLAREIFTKLQKKVNVMWDVSGAIGRRYRRQDEAGTPWCITVDAQSVEDGTFTVRERDSMQQKRMTYSEFLAMMYEALEF
jgi:glycyl-tRNA synthetase